MFDKPVALNRQTHRQLRFRPSPSFTFAAGLHSIPISISEFYRAAKEYAIFFVRSPREEVLPVVVLGLERQENLFVSRDGRWNAQYLPASLRLYPFSWVESSDSTRLQILIDEAYPGFGEEGTALFGEDGDPGPELKNTLQLLQSRQREASLTRQFGAELDRLGLLTERCVRLVAEGNRHFQLDGVWIVDEEKLGALDDADLLRMARQGHLFLIAAHLLSINNLSLLLPRLKPEKARRRERNEPSAQDANPGK